MAPSGGITDSSACSRRRTPPRSSGARASSSSMVGRRRFEPFSRRTIMLLFAGSVTSTSPERRAAWCDGYAEAWAWRLERVVFRLRDAGLDRDCASTGSSATRNPTASAMRRTVSIVGFASSAVSRRRTTSGLAEIRRASSAFVIPIVTRCSSSARIRSSTVRISARARAYSAAKRGRLNCSTTNLSKPVFRAAMVVDLWTA